MARGFNDRIKSFLAAEEPRRPGFSGSKTQSSTTKSTKPLQTQALPTFQPSLQKSPSEGSTVTSTHSYRTSDRSSGRQDSTSSAATSVSVPAWQPLPTIDQHITMRPHEYGYDLPCEFFFVGCNERFDPADYEHWISHTASHFGDFLPKMAICIFCDDDDAIFCSDGNDEQNWRDRMSHIRGHLEDLVRSENIRPDFFIIDHMWKNRLISEEDHAHAEKYSERPYCAHTYPLDYETPKMLEKKERDLQAHYDIRSEERQRRKGRAQDHSHSHGRRKFNKPQIEARGGR